ncbi:MAG: hypothetical protein ABIN94_07845 [Ferruginibacter sp.]
MLSIKITWGGRPGELSKNKKFVGAVQLIDEEDDKLLTKDTNGVAAKWENRDYEIDFDVPYKR